MRVKHNHRWQSSEETWKQMRLSAYSAGAQAAKSNEPRLCPYANADLEDDWLQGYDELKRVAETERGLRANWRN